MMTFRFGKHSGKPIDDPSVPAGYIEWMLGDKDDGTPRITSDAFRRALADELQRRSDQDEPPARHQPTHRGEMPGTAESWSGNDRLGVSISTQIGSVLASLRRIEEHLGIAEASRTGDEPF